MERLRLEIGPIAHGGHCVARHDGRVVFVRHTLPGEVVEAEVTDGREGDRFWRADAVEILEASPDRVDSAWPEAGPGGVGGGELAHVALPAQRGWKTTVIREAFERFAGVEFSGEVRAARMANGEGDDGRGGLRYRTRVSAVAGDDGRASMRMHRRHDFRQLVAMPLATEAAEEALLGGRYPAGTSLLVVDPSGEDGVRVLVDGMPWRAGAVDRRANAPRHVREVVRVGEGEHHYRVAASGFWQVHREGPAILLGEVLSRVGDAPRVLDLYAGSGLFTLPLASTGREVTSVETDEAAVKDSLRNLHDHPNASVVHGDVRETLRSGLGRFDAVVLDPPRSGAGAATLEALAALEPTTIVYVACDPVALARDVATLRGLGYDLGEVTAWDLFPMTHHVEAVATFSRR
ncbi:MAG: class I SAM-dependent RNA methyltransferase [Demequinaceae bacterium]|nr:class I SAM-dependent RNA methyltransferase [Demequinaceae bacterium]